MGGKIWKSFANNNNKLTRSIYKIDILHLDDYNNVGSIIIMNNDDDKVWRRWWNNTDNDNDIYYIYCYKLAIILLLEKNKWQETKCRAVTLLLLLSNKTHPHSDTREAESSDL